MRSTQCGLLTLVACVAFATAQDPVAKKEPDPDVKAKLEIFDEAIKHKKFALDPKAREIIDELLPKYPDMHPKDQSAFLKALDQVFKLRRKRPPSQPELYRATVWALGTIGGRDGTKILTRIYDKKPFDDEEWLDLRRDILENVGRAKDERQIDFLLDEATRSPIDPIMAAGGRALRHFQESSDKIRKDIVKKLLRVYGKIEGDSRSIEVNSELAATRRRTLASIADPWNTTLGQLTGQSFNTAERWQHWYNKNKDGKWQ